MLKDGTRLPYLADGGMTGYTDETGEEAYMLSGFDRVIDVDQVTALLIRPADSNDQIMITIRE